MTTVNAADDQLVEEYTRVRTSADAHLVEVAVVEWQGAHSPLLSWMETARLPLSASNEDLVRARRRLLARRRFFVVCNDCSTRYPKGHTTGRGICHDCASSKHGIVF